MSSGQLERSRQILKLVNSRKKLTGTALLGSEDNASTLEKINQELEAVGFGGDLPVYEVRGFAYSGGGRRVTRVEISLDDGVTWRLTKVYVYHHSSLYLCLRLMLLTLSEHGQKMSIADNVTRIRSMVRLT